MQLERHLLQHAGGGPELCGALTQGAAPKRLCDPLQSEGAPMLGTPSEAPSGTTTNTQMETHLMRHARTRRLGALDEEQVEVGPLLGRGSFGRVYKGALSAPLARSRAVGTPSLTGSVSRQVAELRASFGSANRA